MDVSTHSPCSLYHLCTCHRLLPQFFHRQSGVDAFAFPEFLPSFLPCKRTRSQLYASRPRAPCSSSSLPPMLRSLAPLTARHCRHYARRRPARGGKDARASARDSAFSPTLGKPTKPAAESHHPMHGASTTRAATTAEPPDERVTILGSMVFVVGVMGAGTMGYRLYNFGEISTPVEPQAPPREAGSAEAGAEPSAPLTITVRLSPAAASPLSPSCAHAARGHSRGSGVVHMQTHCMHAPYTLRSTCIACAHRRAHCTHTRCRAVRRRSLRRSGPCCPHGCFGSQMTRSAGRSSARSP